MNVNTKLSQERHLLFIENPKKRVIELDSEITILGRDSSKDIVIESDLISREHATFFRIPTPDPQKYDCRILDGGYKKQRSKNGVFVNEKRCYTQLLQHSDIISFGEVIHAIYLKLELDDERLRNYITYLLKANTINKETRDEIDVMTSIFCSSTSYLSDNEPTSIMLGG